MANIFCTKKLNDFIGNTVQEIAVSSNDISIHDWNAHLLFVDKRKYLIFVNNLTFYTVFVADILKKDIKNIESIFTQRLIEQLLYDRIIDSPDSLKNVFPDLRINFYKTNNNRKIIGRINDFSAMFKYHCLYKYNNISEMSLAHENGIINKVPTRKLFEAKMIWSNPVKNVNEIIKTRD